MNSQEMENPEEVLARRARRARLILYVFMFAGMLLPLALALWTGRLEFSGPAE